MAKSTVTWRVPAGIRSAIDAEASRSGTTPSAVASELLVTVLPDWIAGRIRDQINSNLDSFTIELEHHAAPKGS
jgi:hypothetical protein